VIGDLSALDGAPRSASALAAGEVEATVARGSVLIGAPSDASAAMELLRVLATRLRDADRTRLEFASLDTLGAGRTGAEGPVRMVCSGPGDAALPHPVA
jgi:hypothetical protein